MQEICRITEVKALTETLFSLRFETKQMAALAKPGQFVHIKCGGEQFLRRPISIADVSENKITIVFEAKGEGTKWLSRRRAGEELDLLGPQGRGYDLAKAGAAPIFIGGGIGVPPLLLAARQAAGGRAILGFRTAGAVILREDFQALCREVLVCTDDGSFGIRGFVTDALRQTLKKEAGTAIYACGPRPMLRGVAEIAKEQGIFCQVSMEERMGCGVGACLVCACKVKSEDADFALKHVCKDGPVFNAEEVIL